MTCPRISRWAAVLFLLGAAPLAGAQESLKALVITPQGNVGVSTAEPRARLTVNGGSFFATGKVSIRAGSNIVEGQASGPDATRFLREVVPGNIVWINDQRSVVTSVESDTRMSVDANFAFSAPAARVEVGTNVLELRSVMDRVPRLTMNAWGLVGVGTAQPRHPLHVLGGGEPPLVVEGDPDNYAMLGLKPGSSTTEWQLQATRPADGNEFRVAYSQHKPLLRIQSDGTTWLKQLRVEDVYTDPHPPNWHWLVWDRDTKKVYASGWNSSLRYKEDVRPLQDDVRKLLALEARSFRWKGTQRTGFGLIAEEVHALGLKDLVGYDEQGRPDSVNYPYLSVYVLELVKQQAQQLQELREQNQALRELLCAERPSAPLCAAKR